MVCVSSPVAEYGMYRYEDSIICNSIRVRSGCFQINTSYVCFVDPTNIYQQILQFNPNVNSTHINFVWKMCMPELVTAPGILAVIILGLATALNLIKAISPYVTRFALDYLLQQQQITNNFLLLCLISIFYCHK